MAAGDYIIPGAQAVTEWGSRVGGFINGCGQAALAVIQGIGSGTPPTIAQVTALIQQGASSGATGPTGVSTISGLQQLGAATGTPLVAGSGGASAISTINANLARGLPTEIGVSNAHAFGGSDSNVAGHYVTVVGKAANGAFIVADPNQPQAQSGGFVQYTAQQILNANPFGTLTPANLPSAGGFTAGAISQGITTGFQNVLNGLFGGIKSNLGISGLSDFAWRSALIVGGMVLIVIGLLVFFSKQEGDAVTVVSQQAGNAAKAAAAAA